ncbi:MAG TPA: sugar ABC transporter permease [Streptosporangiales bacterium]
MTISATAPTVSGRAQPGRSGRQRAGYLFVAPFLLFFLTFQVFALLAALGLSFTDWKGSSGGSWVGLSNYAVLFRDPAFLTALWHTGLLWVLTVPILSLGGLGCAYLLTGPLVRFRRTLRTMIFLPTMPSLVVVGTLFLLLLDPTLGLPARLLDALGLPAIDIRTDPHVAIPVIAVMVLWRWFGYNMIIHLAALQNMSRDVLESAELDGASSWQTFWRVVVPMSRPMLLFTTVLSTIGIAALFDEPYVLFGPSAGPSQGGLVLGTYMFRQGFQYFNLGYAAAITYVLTAIVFMFALIQLWVSRDGR